MKNKFLIGLIAAISMTLVVACYGPKETKPTKPASDTTANEEAACSAKGGDWRRVGLGQFYSCVIKRPDAGKSCTDSSQCEGRCEAQYTEEGVAETGLCQSTNQPQGCFSVMENGVAGPRLCID